MVTTLPEGRVDGGTMPPAQFAGLLQLPLPGKRKTGRYGGYKLSKLVPAVGDIRAASTKIN